MKLKQNLSLWMTFLLILACFSEEGRPQPQNYFKGEALPSKSLPRIGRRSEVDISTVSSDSPWIHLMDNRRSGSDMPIHRDTTVPYQASPHVYVMLKRLRADPFRPEEPTGIF